MSAPDDLRRRLIDLAGAAGPWDDPLPEVRRRADAQATTARPDHRRWSASTNWAVVLVAAAVAVVAVGLGAFLVNGAGSRSSYSASSTGDSAKRAAAGSAPSCVTNLARITGSGDAVRLIAPAQIAVGDPATVRARLNVGAGLAAGPLQVYLVRDGAVVAKLNPGTAPRSTIPRSATAGELSATGAFTRTSGDRGCALAANASAAAGGATPGPAAAPEATATDGRAALPPGTYQLIAVVEVRPAVGGTPTTVLVSRPVDVSVR